MDKTSNSSGGDSGGVNSATTTATSGGTGSVGGGGGGGGSNRDGYLKQLNKISHKISKPIRRPSAEPQQNQSHANLNHQVQTSQSQPLNQNQNQNLQQQPPVYNINKSDFRDVVQRLTGSPAHERDRFSGPGPVAPPQPMQQPRPPSSRLHRIRPPPLAQISNRPPNLLNCAPPQPQLQPTNPTGSSAGFLGGQRQPLSPLPPFPSVHGAAESPISAYMRYLQNSVASSETEAKRFQSPLSPLAPRWNNFAPPPFPPPMPQQQQQNIPPPSQHQQLQNVPPPPQQQQQQNVPPPPTTSSAAYPQFPPLPPSPLAFGCLPSPGLLSPSLLFSPTGQLGFQQVPLSPTMAVSSPKWKGI